MSMLATTPRPRAASRTVAPANSLAVRLDDRGRIHWIEAVDARTIVHDREPHASWGRRVTLRNGRSTCSQVIVVLLPRARFFSATPKLLYRLPIKKSSPQLTNVFSKPGKFAHTSTNFFCARRTRSRRCSNGCATGGNPCRSRMVRGRRWTTARTGRMRCTQCPA